jgi:1-acyl-sn-glycerol-3-phosphate acyltransferase
MAGKPSAETSRPAAATAADEEALLLLIRELTAEIHPDWDRELSMRSSLGEEAGLDSLARVELLIRIRKRFRVELADRSALAAETPGDLLRAIREAGRPSPPDPSWTAVTPAEAGERGPAEANGAAEAARAGKPGPIEAAPRRLPTLVHVLEWHAGRHAGHAHIRLLEDGEKVTESISYGELMTESEHIASAILSRDPGPRPAVGIMLATSRSFFTTFMGTLIAGGVPVPLYPPFRADRIGEHLRRQGGILRNAGCRILVTHQESAKVGSLLKAQAPGLGTVCTPDDLAGWGGHSAGWQERSPDDLALLQYTSGSTGDPKGVMLDHGNLLANVHAMAAAARVTPDDVFVSWLPLYHDMGLIGAWLGSLAYGIPLVIMPPTAFLVSPARWLRAIHRHGGTLSASPNFGYAICADRLEETDLQGLDLRTWRRAFNGAEPVSPKTLAAFRKRFEPYGFRAEAMAPVYGLAENSVGLAFPEPGHPPRIDRVDRKTFERDMAAMPATDEGRDALEFPSCGLPLPGHEIRIVDEAGRELPERRVGRIQFRGPSSTRGYFRNAEADKGLFRDGWLESGDLGYMAGGEIFVSGRTKDVLIRAGRHFFPYEVEEAVGAIPGIRKGAVAAIAVPDRATGTEKLAILAETRETGLTRREALRSSIDEAAAALTGMPADVVRLLPPRSIPKTPSGKIRRGASRDLLREDKAGKPRPVGMQIAGELAHSLRPAFRRLRRRASDLRFASMFWILFGLFAPVAWVSAMLPWGNPLRRVRAVARAWFRAAGIRIAVDGLERLPAGPAVLAANHPSWLDGLLLVAALPPRHGLVAKAELRRNPLLRMSLRRIGTAFVERADPGRSAADAAELGRLTAGGRSLIFFPEGTVRRAPGVHPFRMGAFVAAAGAGLPVTPVTLTGSRTALRGGQWFPRRAAVLIRVLPPLRLQGADWDAALAARDECRRRIAGSLGEPLVG